MTQIVMFLPCTQKLKLAWLKILNVHVLAACHPHILRLHNEHWFDKNSVIANQIGIDGI